MPKVKTNIGEAPGFYKGFDIEWLRKLGTEHASFGLVAEYDALQNGEVVVEEVKEEVEE